MGKAASSFQKPDLQILCFVPPVPVDTALQLHRRQVYSMFLHLFLRADLRFPNKVHVHLLRMPFLTLSSAANLVCSITLGTLSS